MQLVAERPATDTIKAQMNYIVDTGTPPVRYIDWPEMEHKEIPPQYKEHEVAIRNGRPLRDSFKLDTHGFVFADHYTKMKDFTDEAETKARLRRRGRRADQEAFRRVRGAGVRSHHPDRRRTGAEDRPARVRR